MNTRGDASSTELSLIFAKMSITSSSQSINYASVGGPGWLYVWTINAGLATYELTPKFDLNARSFIIKVENKTSVEQAVDFNFDVTYYLSDMSMITDHFTAGTITSSMITTHPITLSQDVHLYSLGCFGVNVETLASRTLMNYWNSDNILIEQNRFQLKAMFDESVPMFSFPYKAKEIVESSDYEEEETLKENNEDCHDFIPLLELRDDEIYQEEEQ